MRSSAEPKLLASVLHAPSLVAVVRRRLLLFAVNYTNLFDPPQRVYPFLDADKPLLEFDDSHSSHMGVDDAGNHLRLARRLFRRPPADRTTISQRPRAPVRSQSPCVQCS